MTKATPEIEALAAERLAAGRGPDHRRPGPRRTGVTLGEAWRRSGGTRARG